MAEESPIAFIYDGTAVAVVMATPADLADLAVGFSLTEGIIDDASEIERLELSRELMESNCECGFVPTAADGSNRDSVAWLAQPAAACAGSKA